MKSECLALPTVLLVADFLAPDSYTQVNARRIASLRDFQLSTRFACGPNPFADVSGGKYFARPSNLLGAE